MIFFIYSQDKFTSWWFFVFKNEYQNFTEHSPLLCMRQEFIHDYNQWLACLLFNGNPLFIKGKMLFVRNPNQVFKFLLHNFFRHTGKSGLPFSNLYDPFFEFGFILWR